MLNLQFMHLELLRLVNASVIPDNVRIGKNTAISGITVPEDYPDGELAGGQVITAKDGDE